MDSSECGMRNAECGMKRLTARCLLLTALLLLVAATACDNFDNDKLTEERAMHVFGTKGAPKEPPEDTYSPPEDTYSPPEDTYSPPGGTWKDPTSGLTWQVTPTGGTMNWSAAKAHCVGLPLDGGGWHLPTISELRSLIRGCPGTVTGGACEVTDSCLSYSSCWDEGACWSCSGNTGPAEGCYWPDNMQGTCSWYWSSSPVEDGDILAWYVGFGGGYVADFGVNYVGYYARHVRCVR